MKKLLWCCLLLAMGSEGWTAESAAQRSQTTRQNKKANKAIDDSLAFAAALQALNERDCVIELRGGADRAQYRLCYNFVRIQGDSIFIQIVSPQIAKVDFGKHYNPPYIDASGRKNYYAYQALGRLSEFKLTPTKKGDIEITWDTPKLESARYRGSTYYTTNKKFRLFLNSDKVSWSSGYTGTVVRPQVSSTVWLSGSWFCSDEVAIPKAHPGLTSLGRLPNEGQ